MSLTERQIERAYPYFIGLAAFGWTMGVDVTGFVVPTGDSMLSALVSLGGIFAGFLATLKTLLFALSDQTHHAFKTLATSLTCWFI